MVEGSVGPLLRAATRGRDLVRVIDRDADLTDTFRSLYSGNGAP